MTRALSSGLKAALAGPSITPVILLRFNFAGANYCFNSVDFDITYGSYTYLGNGVFYNLPHLKEGLKSSQSAIQINVSGVGDDLMAMTMYATHKDSLDLQLLLLDPTTHVAIHESISLFTGYFETASITDDENDCNIEMEFTSILSKLDKESEVRMTDEAQKARFPGDKGFEYVTGLSKWSGFWGKAERVSISKDVAAAIRKWQQAMKALAKKPPAHKAKKPAKK